MWERWLDPHGAWRRAAVARSGTTWAGRRGSMSTWRAVVVPPRSANPAAQRPAKSAPGAPLCEVPATGAATGSPDRERVRQTVTLLACRHHRRPLKYRPQTSASPHVPEGRPVDLLGEHRLRAGTSAAGTTPERNSISDKRREHRKHELVRLGRDVALLRGGRLRSFTDPDGQFLRHNSPWGACWVLPGARPRRVAVRMLGAAPAGPVIRFRPREGAVWG